MAKITKAVFPVAGLGTRFFPATKASPKEMLAVVDKPLIQYAVEEAIQAGITQLIFVTSNSKRSIEDHFDSNYELEMILKQRGDWGALAKIQNIIPDEIDCMYVRQKYPLGLGHAILSAKNIVGNEPFAVLLADDLLTSKNKNCLAQMVDIFDKYEQSIVAIEEVLPTEVHKYGIVDYQEKIELQATYIAKLKAIIEKPQMNAAPSRMAAVGRYILTPNIFNLLAELDCSQTNEMQLTDGLQMLLSIEDVYAYRFIGERFDCGSKVGFIKAFMHFAAKEPELAKFITNNQVVNYDIAEEELS